MAVQSSVVPSAQHAGRALSLHGLRRDIQAVEGFNAKFAVLITSAVGTMACAYAFAALACVSLPSVIESGRLELVVSWIAQTFIQLVLLAVIMVGQRISAQASDDRAERTFRDAEGIIDALSLETEGGLRTILDAIRSLQDL